jgi:hypothetical protein
MKKRTVSGIGYALCVVLSLLFCACGNSDINFVKKGTMNSYETTTIGKAFDASFDETKWEVFESKKGEKVVQFVGKISEDLHKSASRIIAADLGIGSKDETVQLGSYLVVCRLIGYERVDEIAKQLGIETDETNEQIMNAVFNDLLTNFWKQGTPVTVQWIITPDGKGFNLSHMSSTAWEGMEFSKILTLIYS